MHARHLSSHCCCPTSLLRLPPSCSVKPANIFLVPILPAGAAVSPAPVPAPAPAPAASGASGGSGLAYAGVAAAWGSASSDGKAATSGGSASGGGGGGARAAVAAEQYLVKLGDFGLAVDHSVRTEKTGKLYPCVSHGMLMRDLLNPDTHHGTHRLRDGAFAGQASGLLHAPSSASTTSSFLLLTNSPTCGVCTGRLGSGQCVVAVISLLQRPTRRQDHQHHHRRRCRLDGGRRRPRRRPVAAAALAALAAAVPGVFLGRRRRSTRVSSVSRRAVCAVGRLRVCLGGPHLRHRHRVVQRTRAAGCCWEWRPRRW